MSEPNSDEQIDVASTAAFRVMRHHNPQGLIGVDNGVICMIEDHTDPDGRMFRLEYQSTPDGQHAIAWCRYSHWGNVDSERHISNGGVICVGPTAHTPTPAESDYDLDYVVPKARYWCTAISVFHETGHFPR